jgi:hypothetical protein
MILEKKLSSELCGTSRDGRENWGYESHIWESILSVDWNSILVHLSYVGRHDLRKKS